MVTGSSKGIGAQIARQLAREGATVIVNYTRSKTDADQVVTRILEQGGSAFAIQADVAKSLEVKTLFKAVAHRYGRVDILVNNTGVYSTGELGEVTEGVHASGFFEGGFRSKIESITPLGRIGQPQDIAPAVAFLASDDASWITGETLIIGGGLR
ncbi:SDR family oxidoreductase [Pseudomonas sp. L5B5]|uniref:SDR family oxidoreductase n=1 Tax=Pseudomonas sp. L5B5 TaxID=2883205 RepID=UPI001CF9FCED|nr:SDR family oxidoreductase [Pseudomonas sp. L5B5]UCZ85414.1 SDR family oxidoreductase [Pseudomonas sp. L5B5]